MLCLEEALSLNNVGTNFILSNLWRFTQCDLIDVWHGYTKYIVTCLAFNIFGSLAEFEREVIRERTRAGLEAARSRGRQGGRPKGLSDKAQQKAMVAETLYKEQKLTVQQIAEQLNISKATLYSYLRSRNVAVGKEAKKV